jgi:hypothetical protein
VFEDVFCVVRDEKCSVMWVTAVIRVDYMPLIDSASSSRILHTLTP